MGSAQQLRNGVWLNLLLNTCRSTTNKTCCARVPPKAAPSVLHVGKLELQGSTAFIWVCLSSPALNVSIVMDTNICLQLSITSQTALDRWQTSTSTQTSIVHVQENGFEDWYLASDCFKRCRFMSYRRHFATGKFTLWPDRINSCRFSFIMCMGGDLGTWLD